MRTEATIGLLAALLGLVTAILGLLNKAGVVEVPVIKEIPIFQEDPGGGGGGGDGEFPTFPEPPITVEVPDVVGLLLEEARDELEERGLQVQAIDSTAIELCSYSQGIVEGTLPPAGTPMSEGDSVRLDVCG